MNIVTLTLNAAFDIHCSLSSLELGKENIADFTAAHPGGKGINISSALRSVGIEETAVVLLGEENADSFIGRARELGVNCVPILVPGRIRENVTVHTESGEETRISFQGDAVTQDTVTRVGNTLDELCRGDTVLAVAGSIPRGMDKEELIGLLIKLSEGGTRIVLDSRSLFKEDIERIKPFLIKPNSDEAANYVGYEIRETASALAAAKELRRLGVENVMISLGEQGAVLAAASGEYVASAPEINMKSTIGAGDSSVAGFIYAVYKGESEKKRLGYAVAFGSAACLREGTQPPLADDIFALLEKTEVR